jgi:hypothetical protein
VTCRCAPLSQDRIQQFYECHKRGDVADFKAFLSDQYAAVSGAMPRGLSPFAV